ncbi:MAG: hypothetical protein ACTSVZ_08805 [Promethearchaeota archaeon]
MARRFVGIDNAKGFGILAMVLLHGIMQQVAQFDGAVFVPTLESLPLIVQLLFLPLALLGLMGVFFIFSTCVSVTIQMMELAKFHPEKLRKYVWKRILNGILLVILFQTTSYIIRLPIFHGEGFSFPPISINWATHAIDAIAWSGAIVPIILYFFLRKTPQQSPKMLRRVFLIFTIIWFTITPIMLPLGNSLSTWLDSNRLYVFKYIVGKFIEGRFKLFPVMGFGLLGVIYGLYLSENVTYRKILHFQLYLTAACVFIFILWAIIDASFLVNFASEDVPLALQILNVGLMPFIPLVFLPKVDFGNDQRRQKHVRRTTWLRRYGIVSLTAFAIGTPFANGIFAAFQAFWGTSVDRSGEVPVLAWNVWQIMLFIVVLYLCWEILLRLWEKIDYKLSLEWFLVKILSLLTGRRSSRMNVSKILYPITHEEVPKKKT